MIPFEMNAENFESYLGGGTADGTRVVAGSGIELDLAEFATDADTEGLWHLHDSQWTDDSGEGRTLTPHYDSGGSEDPVVGPYGATFVAADEQYASYSGLDLDTASQITLEAWISPGDLLQGSCTLVANGWNIRLGLSRSGDTVSLYGSVREDNGAGGIATRSAQAVVDLSGSQWHHVAVTWHDGVALRVWLDGTEAASNTSLTGNGLYAGNLHGSVVYLGGIYIGNSQYAYFYDGLVDEVRISTCVRYAEAFQPVRHLANGTFTSPVFDSQRLGCVWSQLAWSATVPGDAALAMEIVIGDLLDGMGGIVGAWMATENVDDPGRYFQWRASPTPTTEGLNLASPTLQSVTATASEAGANLYHGTGDEASVIDYATPIARLGPSVISYDVGGLEAASTHWFGLRSTDAEGVESLTVDAEVPLELDAGGDRVAARPASVESLEARGAGGGQVLLRWLALAEMGDVPPEVFRIYSNGGSGDVDFANALGDVTATAARRQWQWTTAAQADGATVIFAVRAETLAGGVDADPPEVTVVVDATAPLPVGQLEASPVLND